MYPLGLEFNKVKTVAELYQEQNDASMAIQAAVHTDEGIKWAHLHKFQMASAAFVQACDREGGGV